MRIVRLRGDVGQVRVWNLPLHLYSRTCDDKAPKHIAARPAPQALAATQLKTRWRSSRILGGVACERGAVHRQVRRWRRIIGILKASKGQRLRARGDASYRNVVSVAISPAGITGTLFLCHRVMYFCIIVSWRLFSGYRD